MKKFLNIFLMLVVFAGLSAEITNTGILPKDANSKRIQTGRTIQLYDDANTDFEHLDENSFTTHVNWDVSNDIVDSDGNACWTWDDGDASTLTQINADQLYNLKNNEVALLTYTVYDSTTITGGIVDCWITGVCDSLDMNITAGVSKTLLITSGASSSTANFVINIQADASVTAGEFSIDDIYLTTYYGSPLIIPTGEDITITIPDNAIQLILDPRGTDISIEIGAYSYMINNIHPLPCSGVTDITIGNDSGSTATIYFYFNKI